MPKDANQPTVLITGSSGFLGQAIAHRLRDRYRVIGLDLSPPKGESETEETIKLDITSDESVREAIETAGKRSGGRLASVIHLAAYYDTTGKDNPQIRCRQCRGHAPASGGAAGPSHRTVHLCKHAAGAGAQSGQGCADQRG
ncbi:NAD-dependent epimerase/dehydratase family protein (plasmid) [Sinorhizobium meliloti]|nr:NAD-dependent epimerase/dehydratase family protein [Sinorhizobium meliloti]